MLDEFLHGQPSIYDLSAALLLVLVLVLQLSFHAKQAREARRLAALKRYLQVTDGDLAS